MSSCVKGYVLCNPCRLYPIFEIQGKQGLRHSLEHLSCGTLAAKGKGFVRQRQNSFRPCLFGDNVHTPATVRSPDNVLPLQADDVADAQSRKTGEQSRRLYNRLLAWRVGKHLHLVKRQELTPCIGFLGVFQPWGDVLLNPPFLVGLPQDTFQLVQVVVGGGCHHLAFVLRGERKHVGEKSLAVFHRQIIKGAASAAILFKVLVGGVPIPEIVIVRHLGAEVFQETLLAPVAVEEAEFLVDDGFRPPALDKLRIAKHGLVELRFKLLCRVGIDIDAKIFTPCQPARFRMPDRWVEVKIK